MLLAQRAIKINKTHILTCGFVSSYWQYQCFCGGQERLPPLEHSRRHGKSQRNDRREREDARCRFYVAMVVRDQTAADYNTSYHLIRLNTKKILRLIHVDDTMIKR